MRRITLKDRLRYAFDNTLSRGPLGLIAWLFVASALVIIIVSAIVLLTGIAPAHDDGSPPSLAEVAWMSLMQTLGSGWLGDVGGPPFLLATLALTLGGMFVVGTLIGALTSGIENKLADLRKGRSFVVETGHTVILGWSPQVFDVLRELVAANANRRRACVAILADRDKVEMEDEIRAHLPHTGPTRIVCRTGSPIDLSDLEIVNPHGARAIIVLAPPVADPDSHVIKAILALTNNPARRPQPYHIVAEIRDPKNMEVARMVGREEAQLVLAGDLIARITVQACRQSGLSLVYSDLLDFAGDEIYFHEEPALVGKTFGDALLAYEDSALIGLSYRDGRARLNPPMDTPIRPGEQVIAISRDDDTVRLSGRSDYGIDQGAIRQAQPRPRAPERILILGRNWRLPRIVHELDNYVAPGSQLLVVADGEPAGLDLGELKNLAVSFRQGDTTDRPTLESLDLASYQHAIVLGYSDTLDPQEADARTLITLLHLRDIVERTGSELSIVSEMCDVRNRELAEVTRADDFIVSDRLVSQMLSQLAENRALAPVFADLFDPEGSELYLKPAGDYVELGRPLTFYTVVEAARRRGEVAVGYRLHAQAHGIHLNPAKSAAVTFAERDRIVVLARE